VQNVGTAAAIGNAVVKGIACYERITTITGTPVVNPSNWQLKVGTMYRNVIQFAGGVKEDPAKIISGGPMMGMSVYSMDIPIMLSVLTLSVLPMIILFIIFQDKLVKGMMAGAVKG